MKKLTDLYEVEKRNIMSNGDKNILGDFLTLYYATKNHQKHGTEKLSNIKYDRVLDKETLRMLWTGALVLNYMQRNHPGVEYDECPDYVEEALELKSKLGIDALTFTETVIMTEEIYDLADEIMVNVKEVFKEDIFNNSKLQDTFIHILVNKPEKVSEFFKSLNISENLKEIAESDYNLSRKHIEKFINFLFVNNAFKGTSDEDCLYTLKNIASLNNLEIIQISNEIKKTIEISLKVNSLSSDKQNDYKEEKIKIECVYANIEEQKQSTDTNNNDVVEKEGHGYFKNNNREKDIENDFENDGYVLPKNIIEDITDLMRRTAPDMNSILNPSEEENEAEASITKLANSAIELVKVAIMSVSSFTKPELEEFLMFIFKEQDAEKYETKKESINAEVKEFISNLTDKGVAKVTNEVKSIILRFLEPSSK